MARGDHEIRYRVEFVDREVADVEIARVTLTTGAPRTAAQEDAMARIIVGERQRGGSLPDKPVRSVTRERP